jgi:ankyrin repeat protein
MEVQAAKGRTPLHLAMSDESTALAELLIMWSSDTRRRDAHENTLLHRAAQFGVPDMVLLPLKRYKDMVEARNLHKKTPLHHAAGGQSDNVMLLLKMGASIHAEDRRGRTPRDLAAENKHVEVVEILDEYLPTDDLDAAW